MTPFENMMGQEDIQQWHVQQIEERKGLQRDGNLVKSEGSTLIYQQWATVVGVDHLTASATRPFHWGGEGTKGKRKD